MSSTSSPLLAVYRLFFETNKWVIARGDTCLASFPFRARALYPAMQTARSNAPSELQVLRKDGSLHQSFVYSRAEALPHTDRIIFEVAPEGVTGWKIICGRESLGVFCSKQSALNAALSRAHAQPPSQVLVYNVRGVVEAEHVFAQKVPL